MEFALISDDEFTLTCTSTGGPATTITWTRDSQTAVGERRSEVVNGETAEYTRHSDCDWETARTLHMYCD